MSPSIEPLTAPWYVEAVRADGHRVADVVRTGPLEAAVPSCPGWTLRDLAEHLGFIHRWARLAAATGARPDDALIDAPPSGGSAALADWMATGVDALAGTLASLDVDAPTWHPFPVPRVGAVWPRRQAHETAVHRWDAEHAVGALTALDPVLAADGIAEYFQVIAPRLISRDHIEVPVGALRISCTDVGRIITVTSTDGASVSCADGLAEASGPAPEAVVVGDAESILLALWARRPLPVAPEHPVARGWFGIGGN